ncbi:MAG: hypothetical protein ACLFSQ_06135 [Candidatus Zixiibacteriota bacterium]
MKKLLILLLIFSLFISGCNKKKSKNKNATSQTEEIAKQEEDARSTVNDIYNEIEKELDKAYKEAGKPPVDWDSMEKIRKAAFDDLKTRIIDWPGASSFSMSTMDDHVFIYVSMDGTEKEGDWKP